MIRLPFQRILRLCLINLSHTGEGRRFGGRTSFIVTWGDIMIGTKIWHAPLAREGKRRTCRLSAWLATTLIASLLISTLSAQAATPRTKKPGATIVVKNDRGGSVRRRWAEIQKINQLGQRVEIRGRVCLSSCTMYLAAHDVCVSSRTTFGFHGPHRFGAKLTSVEFEEWSQFIAGHYPTPVRSWYMHTARYKTYNPARLTGAELIRLGVPRCR